MSHILIQHYLADEDKAIIIDCLKHDFPFSIMIGTESKPIVRCKDCKYRTARSDERFSLKEYYCGYEFELCDPYEMTRNAHDPNYFCADAVKKEV